MYFDIIGAGILLLVIAAIIAVIYLLFSHISLKRRVNALSLQTKDIQQAIIKLGDQAKTAPYSIPQPEAKKTGDRVQASPEAKGEPKTRVAAKEAVTTARTQEPAAKSSESAGSELADPPRAIVMRPEVSNAFLTWLKENWFYAVSAISLALAGIFLVQYGIENGLLPPLARVLASLGFGAALIAAGEWVRRRYGDSEDSTTAYLPSTFSGAGIVILFAAILSARSLYGLIGPEIALLAMAGVAIVAVVLGWYYGPFLAAVGIIGAMIAPFVVGGSSDDPSWLYAYFGLITVTGLFVDAMRRWAWVSVVSLVLGYVTAVLLFFISPQTSPALTAYATFLALIAIAIPVLRLVPNHGGAMVLGKLLDESCAWPEFPTRLAAGSVLASSVIITLNSVSQSSTAEFWLSILCLMTLAVALIVWCKDAPALQDLIVFPALGLLAAIAVQRGLGTKIYQNFENAVLGNPEASMPLTVTALVGVGIVVTILAAWRSFGQTNHPVLWGAFAALFAPVLAIVAELSWQPAGVIGAYLWAVHATVIGALMVALASWFARVDGEDKLRTSFATLSALAAIAFSCVIILSSAALTAALAVTVVAAAGLDRRFNLPPMEWFISVGVVTLGYRLIVDPGLFWAQWAPIPELLLSYGGTLAAFVASLYLLRGMDRQTPKVMLDSAAWATGGILTSLLLLRAIDAISGSVGVRSHWSLALTAIIWMGIAFAQLQRHELGGRMHNVRTGLTIISGLIAIILMSCVVILANPLFSRFNQVLGPPVFNTLAIAYLLPGLVLILGAWRLSNLDKTLRYSISAVGVALSGLWLALVIRHFWQTSEGMASRAITQAELYSYTIAILLIGAGLLYQSIARPSDYMRKAGLVVIGLAVAKVYLIDITDLNGLMRVFSLLALGASLAGLAWLNRWAQSRTAPQDNPAKPG